MSVSLSNMGSIIGRMAAENAIESSDTNRLISRSGAELSQAMLEKKNAEKETANDMKAASSYVQMASSAVNVAKAGVKVGQEANNLAQRAENMPALEQNVGAGQAEAATGSASTEGASDTASGASSGTAAAAVMRTSLGNGLTVGERFGEQGTRALLRPDVGARMDASGRVTETREQWDSRVGQGLRQSGLSEGEVDQVWRKAKDGTFDTKDAVNFMWDNRTSPQQARQEDVRNKLMEGIQGQTTAFLTRGLGDVGKQASKNAKRLGEEAGKSSEVASKARDSTNEFNEKLGDLDLQSMRQRRGAGAVIR